MKVIGITFKEGDVFEPLMFLNFTRFCSRETQPVEEAKGQVEGFMKAGDDLYQRGPKRFKKSPFDVMSGDMTYFLKALDLLWCVSSQLHARHPVMQTMFDRSMAALVPRSPPRLLPPLGSITAGCAASAASTGGRSRASLQDRLGQLLEEFYDQGDLLGAQLCVLRVGRRPPKVLADLALGVCGWLQQEMVTPSTLFNLLDISKLIVSFALLDLLRRKKLKLSDQLPLKPPVTVEQVLSHRSGYWQLLPPEIQHLSQLDWEQLLKAWQSCEAIEAPNHAQRYHHSSFGYLCTLAAGGTQNFLEAWDEVCRSGAQMAAELSLDAPPLSLTVPSGAAVAAPQGEVTTPDFAEIADMVANVYVLLGEVKEEANGRSCAETARKELFGREHLLDRSLFSLPETQSKIMPGLQSFGTSRALCALLGAMERQLPEDALRSRKDSHSGVEELATEVEPLLSLEEFQDFGLGIQLVPSSYWRDTKDGPRPGQVPYQSLESFIGETAEEPQAAWGHLAQNGSFVLMLPHQEQPMVVSLLLNMSGRKKSGPKVAKAVLRAIHQHR
ncbi:Hypothetical protein SCF082_LOCUS7593 [Durusdinium trenchii]|uniref:Beta-lactamase-related domain-containing protein n=1 Tax=Durusdinium trenchii TaxID=1381693 RepID=A0ABP0IKG5_9DINO